MQKGLPGYNIELAKKMIRELQERYEKEIKPNEKDYDEPNTKKDFILPILRVLNWDTEKKDQVDEEFCIKNRRSFGSADYALKIDGKTYKSLSEIEEDIEKTDNEIDEMVYEFYGVTDEEKKVIEESLK